MIMGVALLAIWSIGALLLVTDPRNPSSRWASAIAFIGGFGLLAGTLNEEIRPFLTDGGDFSTTFQQWGLKLLDRSAPLASLICQAALPYAFLMFALYSVNEAGLLWRRLSAAALLAPVIYAFWTTPLYPELQVDYFRLALWVIPYMVVASILLISQMWKEKDPILRRNRFFVVILVVFPNIFVLFTIYIARLIGDYGAWKYNLALTLLLFIIFIVFAIKYGVLGVRLRIEQNRASSSLRALTSGTSILNHTLKNELGKIQLISYRMERFADKNGLDELKRDLELLHQSSNHIINMSEKIHEKTQEIELHETVFSLSELIHDAIERVYPIAQARSKSIAMKSEVNPNIFLVGDKVHVQEIFINLLQNAIEAIEEKGSIELTSYFSKKYCVIAIKDTGKGIEKENLPYIFDPFFSTKNKQQNFGLGLAYCFQVMRKHQGLMELESKRDQGSTFFLYFPRKRIQFRDEGEEENNE